MKPRISMMPLSVSDMNRSVDLCASGLSFPKLESEPEVALFTLNASWLGP